MQVTKERLEELRENVDRIEKFMDDTYISGAIVKTGWFTKPIFLAPVPPSIFIVEAHQEALKMYHEYSAIYEMQVLTKHRNTNN